MDPGELLGLRSDIERLRDNAGVDVLAEFLPIFRVELEKQWYSDASESHEPANRCFVRVLSERNLKKRQGWIPNVPRAKGAAEGLFDCLHVTVTPTRVQLLGPYPERSNRVTRRYAHHGISSFVSTSSMKPINNFDSTRMSISRLSSKKGWAGFLKNGIRIGGRRFEFLAYSQSALKEHAVWFVGSFWDDESQTTVDAAAIRREIGQFENNQYDQRLIIVPLASQRGFRKRLLQQTCLSQSRPRKSFMKRTLRKAGTVSPTAWAPYRRNWLIKSCKDYEG